MHYGHKPHRFSSSASGLAESGSITGFRLAHYGKAELAPDPTVEDADEIEAPIVVSEEMLEIAWGVGNAAGNGALSSKQAAERIEADTTGKPQANALTEQGN